jgi:hypothetical protein
MKILEVSEMCAYRRLVSRSLNLISGGKTFEFEKLCVEILAGKSRY